MDLNTFIRELSTTKSDTITCEDFMRALFAATNIDKTATIDDAYNHLQTLPEHRIISIGIDIIKWILEPTPENKQVAFASMDAWFRGLPDPWESI